MELKMSSAGRNKYRKFSLERGGQYAASVARDLDLERWLDREMRSAHVAMKGADGNTPSEGFATIAREEQWPWRVEGRRILEAVLADVDDEKLAAVPFVWARFIQRCKELKRQGLIRVRVIDSGSQSPAPLGAMAKPMLVTGEIKRVA